MQIGKTEKYRANNKDIMRMTKATHDSRAKVIKIWRASSYTHKH